MKLKQARVRMFRNILDSGNVDIQSDVTCLVGKNESGKTAFLQALLRLNPARGEHQFSIPDHYPAWLEKKHRNAGHALEDVRAIEATYVLDKHELDLIATAFGSGVAPANSELRIWRTYANDLGWEHGANEKKAVENVVAGAKLSAAAAKPFKGVTTFDALKAAIASEIAASADKPEALPALKAVEKRVEEVLGQTDFSGMLWHQLKTRFPKFFYFAEYSKLPYSVSIQRVLTESTLTEGEVTARALLRLGGAEQEYVLNPDYERRKRELENVSNLLTDDVLKYWSQNDQLRVLPEITQRTEQHPKGQHSVIDELKVRIWDNRHSLSLPFSQHSAGFQWFFSFFAAFAEYENADPPVIILLDEPAVGLHARAQADFLRFIEERLTKRCQVLYSTHSPFMVQPGKLERVRLVEDQGKETGSVVTKDVLSRERDTLFPLQSALGYDMVQHLFVAEHNLVVEGTSDYAYLRVISDYLASKSRTSLDQRWSIVPVGGADAIPTFVALLGAHLNVTVLVDSRKDGHQRLYRLSADGFLEKQRIILVGDIAGTKVADIEDLFTPQEYLDLYNEAFGSSLAESDLTGSDPIVSRIARKVSVDRFDHGRPADVFLRNRDVIVPKLSEDTLKRFERLFEKVNKTL